MITDPKTYTLVSVKIWSKRLLKPDNEHAFDITRGVIEINMFESLFHPYISGNISFNDTSAIASLINFQGQEIVEITLRVGDYTLIKKFNIFAVSVTQKSISDVSSNYMLEFIEEHGYISYFKHLRGAFKGNISNIISNVFNDYLNIPTINAELTDQNIKVLACNRSPLEFCNWLKDRATSEFGEPLFLYSTLKNGIIFNSLGTLLNYNNAPIDTTFRYSMLPYTDQKTKFLDEASKIIAMTMGETDNIIDIAKQGAIKSKYFSIDTFKKTAKNIIFNASEYHDNKNEAKRVLYKTPVFDKEFEIDNTKLVDMDSVFISDIDTSFVFSDSDSVLGFNEGDIDIQIKKLSSNSDIALLERERFNIMVPGYYFNNNNKNTTIGTLIDIVVPKDKPSIGSNTANKIIDKKRSGKFLITHARHKFNLSLEYVVSLSISRVSQLDPINDPDRNEMEKIPDEE